MIRWLLTGFFSFILLPCEVSCFIAACILRGACLRVCLCLSCEHAYSTKINRIYKREFPGVSKEASPILDTRTSASSMLKRRGKNLASSSKKWVRKIKITVVVKCYALTRKRKKFTKIFENICVLITFIQPEHFLN